MIIGFLQSLRNINEFEDVIMMEDGEIKEQGRVESLIMDDEVSLEITLISLC